MKRLLTTSLLALALSGCETSNMANDAGKGLNVYRDALTGCEYLKPQGQSAALVPRLGYNGEQIFRAEDGRPYGDDDIAADPEGDGSMDTTVPLWEPGEAGGSASGSNSMSNEGSRGNRAVGCTPKPWKKERDGSYSCTVESGEGPVCCGGEMP